MQVHGAIVLILAIANGGDRIEDADKADVDVAPRRQRGAAAIHIIGQIFDIALPEAVDEIAGRRCAAAEAEDIQDDLARFDPRREAGDDLAHLEAGAEDPRLDPGGAHAGGGARDIAGPPVGPACGGADALDIDRGIFHADAAAAVFHIIAAAILVERDQQGDVGFGIGVAGASARAFGVGAVVAGAIEEHAELRRLNQELGDYSERQTGFYLNPELWAPR